MSAPFVGIYTAIYDYQAQNDEELSINENDILYLMQKSDFDDWWLVKKRVLDANADEPQGLVPKTYITPATPKSRATALYDYTKQTEEELSFNEGTVFNVYDTSDPNWALVDINSQQFGFVPGNYIQAQSNAASAPTPQQPTNLGLTPFPEPSLSSPVVMSPVSAFPPPPQRADRATTTSTSNSVAQRYDSDDGNYDNEPTPPMPARPTATRSTSTDNARAQPPQQQRRYDNNYSDNDYGDDNDNSDGEEGGKSKSFFSSNKTRSRSGTDASAKMSRKKSISNFLGPHKDDDEAKPVHGDFAWKIHEIDGKKKRSGVLEIGNGNVYLDIDNKLSESWPITNMTNYNAEKKHIFLDFRSPSYSFELHVSNKSSSQAIMSILGDLKGMQSQSALSDLTNAHREGTEAGQSASVKKGMILYDFDGAADDELTCNEGDIVIIVNDKKSKEWWMVEDTRGRRGVVPSNYVKLVSNKNKDRNGSSKESGSSGSSSGGGFLKTLLGPNSKSPKKKSAKERDREERELREQAKYQHERGELDKQRRRIEQKEKELAYRDREQREKREKIRRADERLRERRMREDAKASSAKNEKDSNRPNPHRVRTWIDRSGAFKVEAEFLGVQQGKIHLHKLNGVKIAVACQKLSSEDLEYVERLTGTSLEKYKQQLSKPSSSSSNNTSANTNENATPSLPSRESSSAVARKRASSVPLRADLVDYWFNFFVEAGVDTAVCDRYATNFAQEQVDNTVLNGVTPALMRTLGVREGDILKIKNKIDITLGRVSTPEPVLGKSPTDPLPNTPIPTITSGGMSDDDWATKPAATPAVAAPKTLTPQITGSIQDLLNVKPMEPTRTGITPVKPVNTIGLNAASASTTPAVTPLPAANTGGLGLQKTGNYLTASTTGIQPTLTGMPMVAMPTGFMPITMIPLLTGMTTGMQPLRTGALSTGLTGGFMNSTLTGGMPSTTFGVGVGGLAQQPQQKTGGFIMPLSTGTMPTTSFGSVAPAGMVKLQPTGVTLQKTGGGLSSIPVMQPTMKTGGGFVPQSSFGLQLNNAMTGGYSVNPALTGGFQQTGFQQTGFPQTSFGAVNPALTGGLPQTSFGVVNPPLTGGFPQASFGMNPALTGGLPQTSFGGVPTVGGYQQNPYAAVNPALTGGYAMNPALTGGLPPTSFGNPIMTGGLPQTSFGGINPALTGGLPPTSFGGLNPALTGGLPPTSFGAVTQQQQSQQALQSQPTGFGFGNSIVPGSTGKQANLANATADNPFGFN